MDIFGFENLSEDSFLQLATTNKDRRVQIRKRKIPWCNQIIFVTLIKHQGYAEERLQRTQLTWSDE